MLQSCVFDFLFIILYNLKRKNKEIILQYNNNKKKPVCPLSAVYKCMCEGPSTGVGGLTGVNQMESTSIASGTSGEPNPSMFHSVFLAWFWTGLSHTVTACKFFYAKMLSGVVKTASPQTSTLWGIYNISCLFKSLIILHFKRSFATSFVRDRPEAMLIGPSCLVSHAHCWWVTALITTDNSII